MKPTKKKDRFWLHFFRKKEGKPPLDLIEALEAKDEKDYISGWDEIRKGVEAGSHDFVHGVGTILFAGTDLAANTDFLTKFDKMMEDKEPSQPETWRGVIDRSPCGTGTCAKMASLYQKKELDLNTDFVHEGILGTTFTGRLIRKTKVGNYDAVVPTITGRAWITGFAQYVVDESDPFPEGYTLGDIWGGN